MPVQDISQVEKEQSRLNPLFRQVAELDRRCWPNQAGDAPAAQEQRLQRHLEDLKARYRKAQLQGPYERLLEVWSADLETRAAAEAFEFLKQCQIFDPNGQEQNWAELHAKLKSHDGRYYFHRAFQLACDSTHDHAVEIKSLASLALTCQPALMPHIAPLVALLHFPAALGEEQSFDEIRAALIAQAGQFIRGQLFSQDQLVPPELRQDLLAEALQRVRPVLAILGTSAMAIKKITQSLWDVFKSVLRHGSVADIDVVIAVLKEWRTVCKESFDPRHPIVGAGGSRLHDREHALRRLLPPL